MKLRVLAAPLACLLVACGAGEGEAPRWIELARGFAIGAPQPPAPLPGAPAAWRIERVDPEDAGRLRVVTRPARADWTDHGGGLWSVARTLPRAVVKASPRPQPVHVSMPELEIKPLHKPAIARGLAQLGTARWESGRLAALDALARPCSLSTLERVYVLLDGQAPILDAAWDGTRVEESFDVGDDVEGYWRMRVSETSVDAVPVLPGQPVRFRVDLPPDAVLSYTPLVLAATGARVSIRVRSGERVLADVDAEAGERGRRRIALPTAGGETEIVLEVDVAGHGEFALAAFLEPVIGPAEIGAPGARPWPAAPDIVLLMADTFRADNLARWGGDPELTPELNAFAELGRCFVATRAPATWTLPSHASLFTARYPREIGVTSKDTRLAARADTLAETLRASGYRTAAVTDAGFVSASFGLDQGFSRFDESGRVASGDMDTTVRAVEDILSADDGRPLFLFVQSYRAHDWVVSEATRARLGERYTFRPNDDFHSPEWRARVLDLLRNATHGEPLQGAEFDEVVAAMEPNYRGAAADTSAGFGRMLARLRERGGFERAVVAFTSDHGEAFGEQGVVSHGNGVWEVQARVPLILRAPGVSAGDDPALASLVDLPRTLCGLAGAQPPAAWGGRDLLQPAPAEHTVFVFQCMPDIPQYVAAVDTRWKWIFADEGGPGVLRFAYDLDADPAEKSDRAGDAHGSDWSARLGRAREALGELYRPALEAPAAQLGESQRRQLDALGYGGDD
ncbi:MAG: sulfatase [bacterium]|nr:sulfatase [bacterium]